MTTTEITKGCKLTQDELSTLISNYGLKLYVTNLLDFHIERINYLNNRLKSFKEPDTENKADAETIKSDNSAAGWSAGNVQKID